MDLSNMPGILALGGIAAIIATGWQHIKTAVTHLSSFLIVRAYLDPAVCSSVSLMLRKEWTLLPSGAPEYHGLWLRLRGDTTTSLVPFKMPPFNSAAYIKGRKVVVFNNSGNLSTIRGICDLDELISDSVKYRTELHHVQETTRTTKASRFQILNVVGGEKGAWASGKTRSIPDLDGGNGDTALSSTPSSTREPDLEVDKILLYQREDLSGTDDTDPFRNLPYDDNVMKMVEDLKHWYFMGQWYAERNIPWRRGVLLSGPPGTGKSTLTQATAELLKIPLYLFHLSTLSNQEFINNWQNMQTPCCAVFEDFDTTFDGREPMTEHKSLTFDCVLNQISGVQNRSGILLFVTTNCVEKIDSALGKFSGLSTGDLDIEVSTRPGRLDVAVHIGPLAEKNKRVLATKTLRDWPDLIEKAVSTQGDFTPPQFEEVCVQLAMKRLREENGTTRTPENHVEIIKDTP